MLQETKSSLAVTDRQATPSALDLAFWIHSLESMGCDAAARDIPICALVAILDAMEHKTLKASA
jgi:hypothetical protein